MKKLRIGQVASATGVSVRAIRHYDGLGLLTSARTENRYRVFQPEDIDRVKLIRLFLSVGFKLDEIRQWGPCFQDGQTALDVPIAEVRAFYDRKLTLIDAQLAALQLLRDKLARHAQSLQQQAEAGVAEVRH